MHWADLVFSLAAVTVPLVSLRFMPLIKDQKVAMQWGSDGEPIWHAPKWLALWGPLWPS